MSQADVPQSITCIWQGVIYAVYPLMKMPGDDTWTWDCVPAEYIRPGDWDPQFEARQKELYEKFENFRALIRIYNRVIDSIPMFDYLSKALGPDCTLKHIGEAKYGAPGSY